MARARALLCLAVLVAACGPPALPVGAQQQEGSASDESSYLLLAAQLQTAEQTLARKLLERSGSIEPEDLARLRGLAGEARSSLYGDLIDRSSLLLLLAQGELERETAAGVASLPELGPPGRIGAPGGSDKRKRAALWSCAGGLGSFALAFTFWYLGEQQNEQFYASRTPEEAARHRLYFRSLTGLSYLSAGLGVLGVAVAIPLLLSQERP